MNNYEGKRLFSSWYIPDFNKPIGTGSFGVVYEMRSYVVSDAVTAVKIISIPRNRAEYDAKVGEMGATEEAVQENFREAKDALVSEIEMMLKVNGFTNCVGCMSYALEEHEDCFGWDILIQMEKLETLDSYFRSKGEIYDTDIVQLGIDMCSALEACELNNIVHRDVKPANIMVKSIKGRPIYKLGDFGVARVLSNSGTMTMSGTFDYMAPELLCGEGDLRVDIYSLGLVLYELLNANRMPFFPDYPNKVTGKDRDIARKKRLTGEPMPDPLYAIGTELAKVIRKACAHDREERYSSPKEMRLALERALDGHTKRAVFTAPAVGAYQPSERKVVVKIAGNCETVPYDGKEHQVEGFTSNGESHNISVSLAPGAAAIARGTQAGRYAMGLTRDSFLVNSQDGRQTVETVFVQDGELVIEAVPHQEKEPDAQTEVPGQEPEEKPEKIRPEQTGKKEEGPRLPPKPPRKRPARRVGLVLIALLAIALIAGIWQGPEQSKVPLTYDTASNKNSESPIIALAVGSEHVVALHEDGTVSATGDNESGQCDVSDWKDIVAISADHYETTGLKADGTVLTTNRNRAKYTGEWTDIIAIESGGYQTVGLKADGTVVGTFEGGLYQSFGPSVSSWENIIAISAGDLHTVGLKADGTVVATGSNNCGQCEVSDWRDIVAVSAGRTFTMGLKSDGTVVTTSRYIDVSGWSDVSRISAARFLDDVAVGIRSDGTLLITADAFWSEENPGLTDALSSLTDVAEVVQRHLSADVPQKDGTEEYCVCQIIIVRQNDGRITLWSNEDSSLVESILKTSQINLNEL